MSRLLKISSYASGPSNCNTRTFDPNSGQVFTETTQIAGSMTSDWTWKTIGSARDFRTKSFGCATLSDMATRSAALHSRGIKPEHLREVPWEIGKRLWCRLVSLQLDSFRIWTVFVTAYAGVPHEPTKRKHHVILEPNTSFSNYISPLISHSISWLTSLTLSDISCSRTDLVQLCKFNNLGVLTIGKRVLCPEAGLDDSIVRAWGRAAAESDAFAMLRVLMCRSQREITTRSFSYLASFPSLAFFNVEDCSIGPKHRKTAFDAGWWYLVREQLDEFLAQNCAQDNSCGSIAESFFRGGGYYSMGRLNNEAIKAVNNLPVLHFSLGAAPSDAAVNAEGNNGMKSFRRIKSHISIANAPSKELKRSSEGRPQSSESSRKKPVIRDSKTQSMQQLLAEFGR